MRKTFVLERLAFALLCCATIAAADSALPVAIDAALANPVMLAGAKGPNYLRVAVTGNNLPDAARRAPLNIAIVIDRSGSMQGEKIVAAKRAAKAAIGRLRPDDTVSVIAYETSVTIVQPATRILGDGGRSGGARQQILDAIDSIEAGGSTALFAGVSMAAGEVRKELRSGRINRIVLLSDGLANVGPSSPGELAELGTSLGREGICVSTLGLGLDYNEDLMSRLASASDGNHMFIDSVEALDRAYAMEFGDAMTVVARNVHVDIHCDSAVRPVRVLGRDAVIDDGTVRLDLGDVSSGRTKYALIELEMPASGAGLSQHTADVNVSFAPTSPISDASGLAQAGLVKLPGNNVSVRYSESKDEVERSTNKPVTVAAVQQIAAERNELAMRLRDAGKIDEARQAFQSNSKYLYDNYGRLDDEQLSKDAVTNGFAADNLDSTNWNYNRKMQREYQLGTKKQGIILEKSHR